MEYNDYIKPSEQDYKIMKQNYDELLKSETADLEEILKKMQNQWNNLNAENTDGKYSDILDKLQGNIDELSGIINNNKGTIFSKNLSPFIPIPLTPRKSRKLDVDSAVSPIRSWDEMNTHLPRENTNNNTYLGDTIGNLPGDIIDDIISPSPASPDKTNSPSISPTPSSPISPNLPNSNDNANQAPNNNTPSEDNNNAKDNLTPEDTNNSNSNMPTEPTPTTPIQNDNAQNGTNTLKRNSPMQSNALFTTIKRFNVTLSRLFNNTSKSRKNSATSTQNNINYVAPQSTLYSQNRYHHEINTNPCLPPIIFYDNQVDIIRLMLLYLMLRPNCKYMSRIAKLTNEQFDILLELKTI